MALLLDELTQGIDAFCRNLADKVVRFLVVVMSEFGRRVKENCGLGPAHDHGSVMLLLGSDTTPKQPRDLPGRRFGRTTPGSRW